LQNAYTKLDRAIKFGTKEDIGYFDRLFLDALGYYTQYYALHPDLTPIQVSPFVP